MSLPQAIMWFVVGLGLLASVRNPTAAVLVVAWAIPQAAWLVGGSELPIGLYRMLDVAVVAIILLKPQRTGWDWAIIAIFAIAWVVYSAPLHPFYQWYLLWALTICQFAFAFTDAVQTYRSQRRYARLWGRPPPGWLRIPWRHVWSTTN